MFPGENTGHALPQAVRIAHHRLEELARPRFPPPEVRRLDYETAQPVWIGQSHQERDDGAIAMPPDNRAIELQGVDHRERFIGGATVKVGRLPFEPRRPSVAGPVRGDDPIPGRKRRDLSLERIDVIAPTTMKDHDRRAGAGVAVVHANRRNPRRKSRRSEIQVRHE